jgi:aspartyl-tRNA(Asn)/glutamyl-tRNA(Gln) amidotransferase subunit A
MNDILSLDATSMLAAYRNRILSPREVTDAVLDAVDRYDEAVNAFCLVDAESARQAAAASEQRWMRREPAGLVDGVPITIKDALQWQRHPMRNGSKTTPTDPVPEDAPAVGELLEAGAVPIGKTTMPEFGWKAVGDSPLYGITCNPWDTALTSGGSSAGAGAASALNLGPLHIGTDAAGSIRIPSSFCGIFGLKPTHGRVSFAPPVPFALIADTGPMSRTVRDSALMLTVMAGPDPRDVWALQIPPPDYRVGLEDGVRGLRIAWSPRLGHVKVLDPEVERLTAAAARVFEELGADVEEADPSWQDPIEMIRTLWRAACWMELSAVPRERWSECDPALVEFAAPGERMGVDEFFGAANARAGLFRAAAEFHERYDLLLTPTVPVPPFETGHNTPPDWRYGDEWFSWAPYAYPFDLTLQPAASVPCGMTKDGLPVGLQIVGPLLHDDLVLRAARAFETARPWPVTTEPRVRQEAAQGARG